MTQVTYSVRYVHKVAPSEKDVGPDVTLDVDRLGRVAAFVVADRRQLGADLRRLGVLLPGARIREWRREATGRIVVFPALPGLSTYWHSVILTPKPVVD